MSEVYKNKLKKFRKDLTDENTQMKLSEELDVTSEYLSKLENGKKSPSMLLHISICLKLNKPSDCFFKNDRNGLQMSKDLFNYLMNLDEYQLKKMLSILQDIYDDNL